MLVLVVFRSFCLACFRNGDGGDICPCGEYFLRDALLVQRSELPEHVLLAVGFTQLFDVCMVFDPSLCFSSANTADDHSCRLLRCRCFLRQVMSLELPDLQRSQELEVRSVRPIPERSELIGVRKLGLFCVRRMCEIWRIVGIVAVDVKDLTLRRITCEAAKQRLERLCERMALAGT